MRRRQDDWINATHILKVADYDNPQRTRILEREVQKGVHEKVQGGYGKYQGQGVNESLLEEYAHPNFQELGSLSPKDECLQNAIMFCINSDRSSTTSRVT